MLATCIRKHFDGYKLWYVGETRDVDEKCDLDPKNWRTAKSNAEKKSEASVDTQKPDVEESSGDGKSEKSTKKTSKKSD